MATDFLQIIYRRLLSRAGLVVLLVLLVLNVGAIYTVDVSNQALDRARTAAGLARNVMTSLESLRSLLFEAESAQRGFLLTSDREYLKPLNENLVLIAAEIETVKKLTAPRPLQAEAVQRLEVVVRDKMTEMEKTVSLTEFGKPETARRVLEAGGGKQMMEYLDKTIETFFKAEDELRKDYLEKRDTIQAGMRWGFAAIFMLNAVLLLAGAYTILMELRRRHDEMLELSKRREELERVAAERTVELRALSVSLQNVLESERHRLARELHDDLGGTLSAIKLDISMASSSPALQGEEKTLARLKRSLSALDDAIKVMRRIIEDLRPTLLDNLGFEAAVRSHCEQFRERLGCVCIVELPEPSRVLSEAHSIALFRVVQEALTNIMKYAKATEVRVSMVYHDRELELIVADNGVGMAQGTPHHATSHGLIGMRERIGALGGSFRIDSAPGKGTRLTFRLPVAQG